MVRGASGGANAFRAPLLYWIRVVLTTYINRTNALLQYPVSGQQLYSTADITTWVNQARAQAAGDGVCIRVMVTISTVVGQQAYNFSSVNLGTPSVTGVEGIIHARTLHFGVASGQKRVTSRNWEWFSLYMLNNPVPASGPPTTWAQYSQGGAGIGSITGIGTGTMSSGSFYLYPVPDQVYTLYLDAACYPISLAADTDPEALPFLFTDAIPYYSAYLALDSSQTEARAQDAQRRFQQYQLYMQRARQFANPDVLTWQYQRSQDPARMAKYGQRPANPPPGGGAA